MSAGFSYHASPSVNDLGAPRPIAFRLRGQDPLLILALGDLQWARGPLLSVSFSLSLWSGSLVPRLWKGIPPTPLLLIARPSRLLRGSGGWLVGRRGAVGISFLPLVGRLVPLSPAGVLLLFSLCCLLCVVCALITYVCCWPVLFVCLLVLLSFFRWCQHARPWFLIRELGELLLAFLSTRGPASCLCSVLLVCLFVFVALRRVVFVFSSLLALPG